MHLLKGVLVQFKSASIVDFVCSCSCSPEGMAENPGLEPTLIGAVSIARRLQDPLSEFVKIGPKHIGVGMYQHDLSEQKLKKALKEVLVECVSFVGMLFSYKLRLQVILQVFLISSKKLLSMLLTDQF